MAFLQDYACPSGHVTEHLHPGAQSSAPQELSCHCGKSATPRISAKFPRPGKLGEKFDDWRRRGLVPKGI